MLSTLLKNAGLSRADLAKAMGVHVNTTYAWNDKTPMYVLSYLELYRKSTKYRCIEESVRSLME